MIVSKKLMVAIGGALVLAACSGGPRPVKTAPLPPAAVAATETEAAFALLMAGDTGAASKKLKAVLKRDPMNANARLLTDSIERDAKEQLGPDNYAYAVRSGDTIEGLAQRLLGNRLKAYQLLRYNDLKAPVTLTVGQPLRIPGEAPRAEPVRRPEPDRPAPTPSAKPKPAAPKPAAPAANPVVARQARAAGLTALNQGNVGRAVALLRRAAALDPGNPLIARDLSRAERIAATVRSRR